MMGFTKNSWPGLLALAAAAFTASAPTLAQSPQLSPRWKQP
jgi:hypothetical protein